MRRFDEEALRETLAEMHAHLGLTIALPERFTPSSLTSIFGVILAAAAESTPTVQTLIAQGLTTSLAILRGAVIEDGRTVLDSWGFKFGTDSTLADSIHVPFGDYQGFLDTSEVDTGAFAFEKTALARYTTYYYAAWAENENGIAHGDTLSFLTLPDLASGLSIASSNLTSDGANLSLTFTDNGGQVPDSVGFWWDNALFSLDGFDGDSASSSSTTAPYGLSVTGLNRYTKYYYTGYVSNLAGRSFVQQPDSFMTAPEKPQVTASWNATSGQLVGKVTDLGGDNGAPLPTATFVTLGTLSNLSDADTVSTAYTSADSSFIATSIDFSLVAGETYYAAGHAANAAGSGSSDTLMFRTLVASSTDSVTNLVATTATILGSFDFGAASPTEVGFKWSTSADLSGALDSVVTLATDSTIALGLTGLTGLTTYYYTAFATNPQGTSFGDTLSFTTKTPLSQFNLFAAVNDWYADSVAAEGVYGHISYWDVSAANSMASLFQNKPNFNSDISNWDVSSVSSMSSMFRGCTSFNQDLSGWDVSSVETMSQMFDECSSFNQDIGGWDVSSVTDFYYFLDGAAAFNKSLNDWDVSSAEEMVGMFYGAEVFNQPLGDWDVSSVTSMSSMFQRAKAFDQPLGNWNVGSVVWMREMFRDAEAFNQPLNSWDVSSVISTESMFDHAYLFNQPLANWDVSNVTSMREMFENATAFDQNLNTWNTASLTNLRGTFEGASSFNSSLSAWNTSNVTTLDRTFFGATSFDQDLNAWDVSNVNSMIATFSGAASFNGDISSWDVSSVTDMTMMFRYAGTFNQPIGNWDVSIVTSMDRMFDQASQFNQAIGSWQVGAVTSMNDMFLWSGFNQDIGAWNVSNVQDMSKMFAYTPFSYDLSSWEVGNVTTFEGMFGLLTMFNCDLSNWDVSSATDLSGMFSSATTFQSDLSGWDVSSATTMSHMFNGANAFSSDLSAWDVSAVTAMFGFGNQANFSASQYDKMLVAWSDLQLQSDVQFEINANYCYGVGAKQSIIDNFNWNITDGQACDPAPSASTGAANNIDQTSADLHGSFAGMSAVSAAGFKVSTDSMLTGAAFQSAGSSSPFTLNLTGLEPSTVYYYRAFATDELGTALSDSTKSFETHGLPQVSTVADTTWTDSTATLIGTIDYDVIPQITATGFKWGAQSDLSDATDVSGNAIADTFTFALSGSGPIYYSAYATNAEGTTHGDTVQLIRLPELLTQMASGRTDSTATLNGVLLQEGRSPISASGFKWGYEADLSDGIVAPGDGLSGAFAADIEGLVTNEVVYFIAFATNAFGTNFGDTLSFTVKPDPCINEQSIVYEGYAYELVSIGEQCWFAENLRNETYANGDSILSGLTDEEWRLTTLGAQAVYGDGSSICLHPSCDEVANLPVYGRLYNWLAVIDNRGLCPQGFVVPDTAEWNQLQNFVSISGHAGVEGNALKALSVDSGTDDFGFKGLLAGIKSMSGKYYDMGELSGFWTRTVNDEEYVHAYDTVPAQNVAYNRMLSTWDSELDDDYASDRTGRSVRCIRTQQGPPVVATNHAVDVTDSSATLTGFAQFNWEGITATGFKWGYEMDLSDGQEVTGNNITGVIHADLTGLVMHDTVYFAVFSTNALGTVFGDTLSFEVISPFACANLNHDGYDYNLVKIGNQCWFAENLRSAHYRDGSPIPGWLDDATWSTTTSGAQAIYFADSLNFYDEYGRLYNWHAVEDERGLCPAGWRIPDHYDFGELEFSLGGRAAAFLELMASPSDSPSWAGDNGSGFSAAPGGARFAEGNYSGFGATNNNGNNLGWLHSGYFWTSVDNEYYSPGSARARVLNLEDSSYPTFEFAEVNPWPSKKNGYSVRCLKE